MKDEDGAEQDLTAATGLLPEDVAIAAELAKVKQRKKEYREREKRAYKKMFS